MDDLARHSRQETDRLHTLETKKHGKIYSKNLVQIHGRYRRGNRSRLKPCKTCHVGVIIVAMTSVLLPVAVVAQNTCNKKTCPQEDMYCDEAVDLCSMCSEHACATNSAGFPKDCILQCPIYYKKNHGSPTQTQPPHAGVGEASSCPSVWNIAAYVLLVIVIVILSIWVICMRRGHRTSRWLCCLAVPAPSTDTSSVEASSQMGTLGEHVGSPTGVGTADTSRASNGGANQPSSTVTTVHFVPGPDGGSRNMGGPHGNDLDAAPRTTPSAWLLGDYSGPNGDTLAPSKRSSTTPDITTTEFIRQQQLHCHRQTSDTVNRGAFSDPSARRQAARCLTCGSQSVPEGTTRGQQYPQTRGRPLSRDYQGFPAIQDPESYIGTQLHHPSSFSPMNSLNTYGESRVNALGGHGLSANGNARESIPLSHDSDPHVPRGSQPDDVLLSTRAVAEDADYRRSSSSEDSETFPKLCSR